MIRMGYSTVSNIDQTYIPRRTVMYVPGHDPKKLKKIPNLGVDCAVLECEDGVAINMKVQARKNIREALEYLIVKNMDLALRVNSCSSQLMEDDLGAIIGSDIGEPAKVECLPQTILLPKVDHVQELVTFTERLKSVKLNRKYCPYLITYVESTQGLMNMRDIMKQAAKYSEEGIFRMDGVVFGSDDFVADIGADRTSDAKELIYARQKIIAIAKAFRLQVIDMVHVDIEDLEGLKRTSIEGAKMGYTGKQVIHPKQIQTVQEAFTPSPVKVKWAQELIEGFEQHQKSGKGAFVFRGQMIDMPLLRQAKNILRVVENVHRPS
ncbi:citrate lyase subunit beta protein, mitochondrial [Biomphalaria glabrata]|nr:citrate lyase subunit beta-like protein; mitochondrial [Biomphalaria glabrata]KAI8792042.1 citrate lyase subunit beta protein, mitochondrial [Biomphalaria glabrata]